MTTILVTGGNGQLASCIKDISKVYNHFKFIYTNRQDLDICDYSQLDNFFKLNTIDYCINCAAYTAVDKAEEDVEEAFLVNAIGAKNLAEACKIHQITLMHISTDFVFDGTKQSPYLETDSTNPLNIYGKSKLQGELEIQKILDTYFIIRTSWLYSEYGNNFMKTMLRLAESRKEISVVNDQIGTPTYAGDLARVILHLIDSKTKVYGEYHYSNLGEISWYDFANAIFKLSNKNIVLNPINTVSYPTPANRPKYSVLDKSKISKKLNVSIPYWDKSLELVINKF
ncbi:dTDP-4-dehydrorhamnose reductase [Siansivirga zeaxanthinifaciens]|uniref:dTDP-4-dehydrorhamnose reductase n=1 Tax=Siansivirga zeaxanthinifaciens CC-SAMT-1 TaxID=1454006 RepID=A0A0C5WBZ3_9FLAO|nr:dTDP-4-dehydrorhamnose reductase [Siansivirga zeaxanthinifaciens]AJR02874.1 dTDP-4-dehydrorhamnose reductase [Siansivirga zeaxanthinifaciens CC-SAMT-1]